MSRSLPENRKSRLTRFEEFESRLVMSAQAVASVLPDLDPATTGPVNDQVEVSTFSESAPSFISETASAAAIGQSFGLDGTGQTIAVIDTGIAFDHIALGGGFGEGFRVVGGYDFAEGDANPFDDGPVGFHGTHVAGIIGSSDSTFTGVAAGADLVALRVFDDFGATQLEWIEQSLQWVHDNINTFENPITTVNLSLGTSPNEMFLEVLNDELQQLEEDGIFISVAAGNSFGEAGASELAYPASSEFVVPVASHDRDGQLSDFSQRASHVLTAPGQSITSTVPDHLFFGSRTDSFLGTSGTSQAAPYVAGASALLRQAYEVSGVTDIDQDLLYDQFISTADSIYDPVTGQNYSQINLQAALESVLGDPADANQSGQDTQAVTTESASIALNDGVLTIVGTTGNDQVSIAADDHLDVAVNGITQRFDLGSVDSIVFDGNEGEDAVEVNLTGTDDQVQLLQNRIEIRNQQFSLTAFGIEDAVVENGDGNDRLYVQGSQFDDVVKVSGTSVLVSNEEFAASGGAFRTALVVGEAGSDAIEFEGDSGADRFSHSEDRTYFRSQQLEVVAKGFEQVQADGNGGADLANLIGTSANDVFEINQTSAVGTSAGGVAEIEGFQRINAINTQSGDRVTIAGSDGDDVLHSRDGAALLVSETFSNYVSQISNVTVSASGGNDVAYVLGTAGDDHFEQSGEVASLQNADGKISIEGYDLVVARSGGGNDTARFEGSDQREQYFANTNTVQVTDSQGNTARALGFADSSIDGGGGGDLVDLRGGVSNETLRVSSGDVEFETTLQLLMLTNVENSRFDGGGGVDRVELDEVQHLDLLDSLGDGVQAVLERHTTTFSDVDDVEANAVDEAIAAYDLEAVDLKYGLGNK